MEHSQQSTEEQRTEAYRHAHVQLLERQTNAIESIKTYVAVAFWCSLAAAVVYVIAAASAPLDLGY